MTKSNKPNTQAADHQISRRRFVKTVTAAATTAVAAPAILRSGLAYAAGKPIKFGYVSPKTGPLAPFAEADDFVIGGIRQALKDGVKIGNQVHPIEIIVKDTQSNPNRCAEVAAELILKDEVNILLAAGTPETTNPASDQAEANEVPCITSDAPWQPYFFGRGGNPAKGFNWTYHFFWGLEDVIAVFLNLWNSLDTNKTVGALWPNDSDGNAWGSPEVGFPPALQKAGFKLVDPGRYQAPSDDFTAQISAFKKANVEIVSGVMIPPDFTTFWTQAAQQGFKPKAVTVGKALLFPAAIEALGDRGTGLSSEVWWTPSHPFKSSLTGVTAGQLSAAYEQSTNKQWTQPIGFRHALFEVATDVLKRTKDVNSPQAIVDAIASTNLDTIVGKVNWAGKPVKNVSKTPLVGGQWVRGSKHKYDLKVVDNKTAPNVPLNGKFTPIT
jgi:branched-chain amino acid transport system substrate-binding protein